MKALQVSYSWLLGSLSSSHSSLVSTVFWACYSSSSIPICMSGAVEGWAELTRSGLFVKATYERFARSTGSLVCGSCPTVQKLRLDLKWVLMDSWLVQSSSEFKMSCSLDQRFIKRSLLIWKIPCVLCQKSMYLQCDCVWNFFYCDTTQWIELPGSGTHMKQNPWRSAVCKEALEARLLSSIYEP